MPGRHVITLSALLGAAASSIPAWAQQEVDFAQELGNAADGVIVIETHPTDQVLVLKGGTHYLGGRELIIRAPLIRIDETTTIQSFDPSSTPREIEGTPERAGSGTAGGSWGCRETEETIMIPNPRRPHHIPTYTGVPNTEPYLVPQTFRKTVCNRNGDVGRTGAEGLGGSQGAPAKPISLSTATINGPGKLVLIGNGQQGGKGQKGGSGGQGGDGAEGTNRGGDLPCGTAQSPLNGGPGGMGGMGGAGGKGGSGGAGAQIYLPRNVRNVTRQDGWWSANGVSWTGSKEELSGTRIFAAAIGGRGGKGGTGGDAGPGGGGGGAGKGSHCGGGSDVGSPGTAGSSGPDGSDGPIGPRGNVTFN